MREPNNLRNAPCSSADQQCVSKTTEQRWAETPRALTIRTLNVNDHPAFDGHEEVLCCHDTHTGLRAIIAVHSTTLGPALGGCRMWAYTSEYEALTDVLRLSRGMSYKHAVADTCRGGGKAVIIGDLRKDKTPELLRAFGAFVDELAGRYITAEDVGVSIDDVVVVHRETKYVAGLPIELSGSGDPSPFTAYGVFCGIKAAVAFQRGLSSASLDTLAGVTIAVQGLGKVGYTLCRHLATAGADLIVTDIRPANVARVCDEFRATPVEPESIFGIESDVFAPCALGAVLTKETVGQITAKVIAGAANNQLACLDIAELLRRRSILYAPDYVINAGGIINISHEDQGYDAKKAYAQTSCIGDRLTEVFQRAATEEKTTAEVADAMAKAKLFGK